MPAPSELLAHLRIGSDAETADAVTRSHVADGRVVGWYGEHGVVIDAEISGAEPPSALVARYGASDFWGRWTAAECRAKLSGVPIVLWLREHGLEPPGADLGEPSQVVTLVLEDLTVSVGRAPSARTAPGSPQPVGSGRSGAGR